MPRKEYLSQEARRRFDYPPVLNSEQKSIFLNTPVWATQYLKTLQTPTTKVGFLLQVGYFRLSGRFYIPGRFNQSDVDFISIKISVDSNAVDMNEYVKHTIFRHQKEILEHFGFVPFDNLSFEVLLKEAERLAHVQTRPDIIFEGMVSYLQDHHIEIPAYNTLRTILEKALNNFEKTLESILSRHLTPEDTALLDQLLVEHSSYQEDSKKHLKVKRYELTFLKKISQSMKSINIKDRVHNFEHLKKMYFQLLPVAKRLKLSDSSIQFYAEYVIDSQVPQITARNTMKYLLLIAFVIHQYYLFGDALILTLNSAITNYINGCENIIKQELFQNRIQTSQLVNSVTHRSITHIDVLTAIEKIIADNFMEPIEKIKAIDQLLKKKQLSQRLLQEDQQRLNFLSEVNQKVNDREDYYLALEKNSSDLSKKVSNILKVLVASQTSSGKDILAALLYFQQKDGVINAKENVPTNFLQLEEKLRILTKEGKLRVGLYKLFLFRDIRDNIKSGALAIDSSYDYRPFEEYLIPQSLWKREKEKLIEQAGLTASSNSHQTLAKLNEKLNEQIKRTNANIESGQNKQVYFDSENNWHLKKDKRDEEEPGIESLYPQDHVISLLEVLTTVQNATDFVSSLVHHNIDYMPKRPENNLFFAAIIGYGCNIGIRKFSFMSKGIRTSSLETTALHYFSPEKVIQANDKVITFSNSLPLTGHFRKDPEFIHTSSDGQKYDVAVPSLVASPSFKYFGNKHGISRNSFLDEAGQLYYFTVFSAAEPESHYLLDGLTHNEVILPNAHSTDTHGFSEPVFAITGLLNIEFRPRFARFHHQQLYSIDDVRTYRDQNFKIIPHFKINKAHLESQWDEILRLVCTIKLGYAKASTLFNRLNSYSKQHPLYKALKDLGRINKTIYIYQYMDVEMVRKSVSEALSLIESSNNFSKAITIGNNQELIWATRREQLIAEGCKSIISNAINTYNLLYLSELLVQKKSEEDRQNLLKNIIKTSTLSWAHINLVGEYDFTEGEFYKTFDLIALKNLNLGP